MAQSVDLFITYIHYVEIGILIGGSCDLPNTVPNHVTILVLLATTYNLTY